MKLLTAIVLINFALPICSFANTCQRELSGKKEIIDLSQLKHSDADGSIRIIKSEDFKDGDGVILTAESSTLKQEQGDWKPYELFNFGRIYPRILKELNISFIGENQISYPSPAALNSILDSAVASNANYQTALRFMAVNRQISSLAFLKSWSQKLIPYAISGEYHYHDMNTHAVGYILMPNNFVHISSEVASWILYMRSKYKLKSIFPGDYWDEGIDLYAGQIDSFSYQIINTLSRNELKDLDNYLYVFSTAAVRFLKNTREYLPNKDKDLKQIDQFISDLESLTNEPKSFSKLVVPRAKSRNLVHRVLDIFIK